MENRTRSVKERGLEIFYRLRNVPEAGSENRCRDWCSDHITNLGLTYCIYILYERSGLSISPGDRRSKILLYPVRLHDTNIVTCKRPESTHAFRLFHSTISALRFGQVGHLLNQRIHSKWFMQHIIKLAVLQKPGCS